MSKPKEIMDLKSFIKEVDQSAMELEEEGEPEEAERARRLSRWLFELLAIKRAVWLFVPHSCCCEDESDA